jgi:ATP-dependent DNA helicase RecG
MAIHVNIEKGIIRNKRYRNRRIGDFLKELDMTEGRGTGIPIIRKEMMKNGSPEPRFETDDYYSYFITTLPVHPAFLEKNETSNELINEALNENNYTNQITDNKYYNFFNVLSETLNETLKNDLAKILELIHKQSGITQSAIINEIGKSRTTTFRYLNILKNNDWIEYQGAKKTGGYHLTGKAKGKLK